MTVSLRRSKIHLETICSFPIWCGMPWQNQTGHSREIRRHSFLSSGMLVTCQRTVVISLRVNLISNDYSKHFELKSRSSCIMQNCSSPTRPNKGFAADHFARQESGQFKGTRALAAAEALNRWAV